MMKLVTENTIVSNESSS